MSTTLERHWEDLASNPEDVQAFEALQEHFFLECEWEKLTTLYRRRLEAPSLQSDTASRLALLFRLAQVLEERCGCTDQAEEVYWEVAKLDPSYRPALRQLREIYSTRQQWDMLLQTAEIEGQIEMSPGDRASFQAEMGRIWLDHLDDAGEALSCFEQAVETDPYLQPGLSGLARTLQIFNRPADAARVWQRLIEVLRGPERAPALVSLGKLYAGPLRDLEAASKCLRRAMTDDPRNPDAVESLIVIASAQEQWGLLGDLFERRFNLASGARHRSAIAVEAGNIHLHRLRDPEGARTWFDRARELAEDDVAVYHALAELHRVEGNRLPLRDALDRILELSSRTSPVSVLLEAADLHSEGGDPALALEYLQQARQQKPDDPLVIEALSEALAAADRPRELVEVLEQRAALATDDPESRADSLAQLSRIYENDLEDPEAAIDALSRLAEISPEAPDTEAKLRRLYRKAGRWVELRGLLERVRGHGSPAAQSGCCCELGSLLLEQLSDLEAAREAFESALALDPDSTEALRGLERVARDSGDEDALLQLGEREAAATSDPQRLAELIPGLLDLCEARDEPERGLEWAARLLEVQPENRACLDKLARLQRQLGRHDELIDTLERIDRLVQGAEQAENRRTLAGLYDQLGHPDRAIAALEAAIESAPDDLRALRTLKSRYEAAHQLQNVARIQRRLADALPPRESAACLDDLATLLVEQLGDVDAAIVVLWRLCGMAERPADAGTRLESLLERAGRFEELAQQLLERRRSLPDDSEEAEKVDLRRAQLLLGQLGQLEEAGALFRTIRSRNPACTEATDGLEQALRSGNDSAGLVLLLESRARNESDPRVRAQIDFERGVLLEEALGDQDGAQRVYDSLASQTDDLSLAEKAGQRIERVLELKGDWEGLRQRLTMALGASTGEDEARLRERLASLCRDRLGDQEACIEHLEALGVLAPSRVETWRDLAVVYSELERDRDLLRVMRSELDCEPDPGRELVLQARLARLCRAIAKRDDTQESDLLSSARESYERVLELEPTHTEASEFLVDHYEAAGRPADVVRLLRTRIDSILSGQPGDTSQLTSLRLRLARLLAEQLNDVEGATEILQATLDDVGPIGAVAEPLFQLYRQGHDCERVVNLCRRTAEYCDDPGERAQWHERRGDAHRFLGELPEAAEAYCDALVERPGDRGLESTLCDLYRELDEPKPLATLLEAELERLDQAAQTTGAAAPGSGARAIGRSGASEQVSLRLELARLLSGQLDRGDDALSHLQVILEIEPDNVEAFDLAMELSEEVGRETDVLSLLDTRLAATTSSEERGELLERRGNLLAGALDRPEEAASALREAVALRPDDHGARQSLRAIMERLERWPAVLDCLHLDIRDAEGAEREAMLEQAVEIADDHLSSDAALPWLERLRALRPDDPDVVRRMGEVHRKAGRPEALLRCLDLELTLVSDRTREHALHVERARILERDIRAPSRAINAYETARDIVPDDPEILAKLDQLYDLTGRIRERVEILEARIEGAESETRIELHRHAAALCAASLAEPERAIPHLLHAVFLHRESHGTSGRYLELLRELAESLRAASLHDAWARASETELTMLDPESSDHRTRRIELHHELATVCGHELGLPEAQLRHLEAVMALNESADPAEEPCLPRERLDRVERELIGRLRADRNHVALAMRLSARLTRGDGDADEWLELARLQVEQLHAPARAADAYREVLARQPGCLPAIRGLRHVAECLCDWAGVAHTLELELALPERWSPRELVALQTRLGEICWRRLASWQRAIDCYRAALEAVPGDLATLRALQPILVQNGRADEAVDLYEREIEILEDREPEQRHELWLKVAHLRDEDSDESRRALLAFEAAAEIGPLSAEDQRRLAELYRAHDDLEGYAEAFAVWCDHTEVTASGWDQLALVSTLQKLGQMEGALERAIAATETDERNTEAWEVLASLYEQRGDHQQASEALERSAALHQPGAACEHLMRAAALCEPIDPRRAAQLVREASRCDPGSAAAQATLARIAEQQGELGEAVDAAGRALDLAAAEPGLEQDQRLALALIAGRGARATDRLDEASRFYAEALEIDADNRDALDAQGELLFERGEYAAASKLLEARLAMDGPNPERGRQLAIVARGLEHKGEDAQALARYREALDCSPGLALAHEGTLRIHEQAGHTDLVVATLERWIANDADAKRRASSHLHVAEWVMRQSDVESGEAHLRKAVFADPGLELAWVLLTELLSIQERENEALEQADRALCQVRDPMNRARISMVRGPILERRHKNTQAIEAYKEAANGDKRCVEAAVGAAKLLRTVGDWQGSADVLQTFSDGHPDPDSVELTQIHLERGRLMAGPLEDMVQAIDCYERALELTPGLREAREPLASLLAHVPDRWQEALRIHGQLLEQDPSRQTSLRALLEISRRRDLSVASELGLSVLRALGCASPEELAYAADDLPVPIDVSPVMSEPIWEIARQICQISAQEIATVLPAAGSPEALGGAFEGIVRFRTRLIEAEGMLTAPGVCELPSEDLSTLIYTVTALAADPGGNCNDSPHLHDLDQALGRWTRRKVRKALGDTTVREIQALDCDAWRAEIRSLAAGFALNESGRDLRSALVALCRPEEQNESPPTAPTSDISSLVSGSGPARELLARVVAAWCSSIADGA